MSVAILTWVFACPIGLALLNWQWGEWRKSLEKDIDLQQPQLTNNPAEQGDNSVRKPLY